MKRPQSGEAMLAVMIVMLILVSIGSGHLNMMGSGHGADQVKNAGHVMPQSPPASPPASAPQQSQAHPH